MGEERMALLQPKNAPAWMQGFGEREQEQIIHARAYAIYHASAGAPGHGQFLLIAKLASLLDEREPHENG